MQEVMVLDKVRLQAAIGLARMARSAASHRCIAPIGVDQEAPGELILFRMGSSQGAQLEVYTLHSPLDAIQKR